MTGYYGTATGYNGIVIISGIVTGCCDTVTGNNDLVSYNGVVMIIMLY